METVKPCPTCGHPQPPKAIRGMARLARESLPYVNSKIAALTARGLRSPVAEDFRDELEEIAAWSSETKRARCPHGYEIANLRDGTDTCSGCADETDALRCFSAGCTKPQMQGSVLCEEHYNALPAPMRQVEKNGHPDPYKRCQHDPLKPGCTLIADRPYPEPAKCSVCLVDLHTLPSSAYEAFAPNPVATAAFAPDHGRCPHGWWKVSLCPACNPPSEDVSP